MRPVAPPTAAIHFRFADALRSIAIVSVVLSHIVMVIPCLRPLVPFRLALGSWGVDAFFVLSGFLLGRPYVDALLGRRPLPNWRRYARRRFLRIWPAYAAVVVFAFAKTLVHHGASAHAVADTITHLLMIHNFFPAFVTGADNIALWTMAVDAQFYVVLPLVAWALFRRTATHLRPDVLIVLACVVILSLTWRLTVPFFSADTAQSVLGVQRNLIGMGTSFAVGVFLAYLSAQAIAPAPGQARVLVAAALTLTCADYATAASFPGLFKDFALECWERSASV